MNILIADSSSAYHEMVVAELATLPNRGLFSAGSLQSIIDTVTTNHIDVIIMDLEMCGDDSITTIGKLTNHPSCIDTPIVVTSNRYDLTTHQQLFDAGAIIFFTTPFERGSLLTLVTNITNKNKGLLQGIDILLADDFKVRRNMIRRVLNSQGANLFEAADGDAALTVLQEHPIDILITDLVMPNMGGLKLTQYIREELGDSELPIMLITTASDLKTEIKALHLRVDDFLAQPFSHMELVARIINLHRRSIITKELKEWKRNKARLLATAERDTAILNAASDAIVMIDRHATIEIFNQAAESIFGYRSAEVIGSNISLLMSPELAMKHDSYVRNSSLHSKRVFGNSRQLTAITKGGDTISIELNVTPVIMDDGKTHFVGVIRDISASLLQTQRLQQAQQLADKANQAKSDFISSMSHELRTPLNAILGFAEMLNMGTLDERQHKCVNHILQSGRHLLELVNDILDLAKVESGNTTLSIEDLTLRPLVGEVISTMTPIAEQSGITIHPTCRCSDTTSIRADRTRVTQILTNLIGNAIKYSRENGSVWITCQYEGEEYVRTSVRDDGLGISSYNHHQVFAPFQRLGHEQGEIEGSGIGLAYSKKLVEIMGGSIGFESQKGSGSTFWFTLPRGSESVSSLKESPPLPAVTS
ncbi:MAG: response regulator, partial [Mariprofundales bacterium]|nr:response regulator [Mariprofundales bacterium]